MVALGWVAVLCHVSALVSLLDCLQSGSGKRERRKNGRGRRKRKVGRREKMSGRGKEKGEGGRKVGGGRKWERDQGEKQIGKREGTRRKKRREREE